MPPYLFGSRKRDQERSRNEISIGKTEGKRQTHWASKHTFPRKLTALTLTYTRICTQIPSSRAAQGNVFAQFARRS